MELLDQVEEHSWYHCLELGDGRVTDGWFDLRPYVSRYGLPDRMDGMRALDIGTFDGFWAFEMERRGAAVVALDVDRQEDLDCPPRRRATTFEGVSRAGNFQLAKDILGSRVERVSCSVYDARPEDLGTFDLVFCGVVLLHLRDQLLALERIADLCDGVFVTAEEYDRPSELIPFPVARYHADRDKDVVFWLPSAKAWRRMLWTAGFDRVERKGRFTMRSRKGFGVPVVVHHAHKHA